MAAPTSIPLEQDLDLTPTCGPRRAGLAAGLACLALGCTTPEPQEATPDFGHPDSVLTWTPSQQLAGFPAYDVLFETRVIPASERPVAFAERLADLTGVSYEVGGESFGVTDFIRRNRVSGLLVVQADTILFEEYALGHDPEGKWVSYSVAKSLVSMLVGAAIQDGYIDSVDDLITDYLPVLAGSAYDSVRIRDVLQMASGVDWNEDYTDPDADVSREIGLTNLERLHFLSSKDRVARPGERFNYSTGETHLVGAVVRAAVGNNLSAYLTQKIWQPFGMESAANWLLVEPYGAEHGGCCLSATLRDYAKVGQFALRGGRLSDGTRVLPEGWMAESTTPSTANPGYGYLWWLADDGTYAARGIFGQMIHIDPALDLVVVTHGAWQTPTGREFSEHRSAFLAGLKSELRAGIR